MITIFAFFIVMILCFMISFMRGPAFGMDAKETIAHVIVIIISGFAGVKLLYALQNFSIPPDFSGLSFFGTFYFAPIGVLIYNRITKTSWVRSMDFVSLYAALALVLFRINCFRSGCCGAFEIYCFGKTVTPPIQLIEAFFDFLIFAFLWYRESKPLREGAAFPLLLSMYGVVRLVMENYRAEERSLCGMSSGQWNSIICIVVGGIWLYQLRNKALIRRVDPQMKKR